MYTFLMFPYTKQSKRTCASSSTLSGQNGHARFASERERERQRDRERQRETDRQRQRDRETDRQRERENFKTTLTNKGKRHNSGYFHTYRFIYKTRSHIITM